MNHMRHSAVHDHEPGSGRSAVEAGLRLGTHMHSATYAYSLYQGHAERAWGRRRAKVEETKEVEDAG